MKQITKNNEVIREEFDVRFVFNLDTNNIDIFRLSGGDKMTTIFIEERLNHGEFKSECINWCDQNAA